MQFTTLVDEEGQPYTLLTNVWFDRLFIPMLFFAFIKGVKTEGWPKMIDKFNSVLAKINEMNRNHPLMGMATQGLMVDLFKDIIYPTIDKEKWGLPTWLESDRVPSTLSRAFAEDLQAWADKITSAYQAQWVKDFVSVGQIGGMLSSLARIVK